MPWARYEDVSESWSMRYDVLKLTYYLMDEFILYHIFKNTLSKGMLFFQFVLNESISYIIIIYSCTFFYSVSLLN